MTGFSSRIAAVSSPFASAGVDGITSLSPATCANHASSDLECCAAVLGDVLADHDDPRIPLHLETEGVAERLVVEHLARSRTCLGVGDRDLCPHAGKPACFSA